MEMKVEKVYLCTRFGGDGGGDSEREKKFFEILTRDSKRKKIEEKKSEKETTYDGDEALEVESPGEPGEGTMKQ